MPINYIPNDPLSPVPPVRQKTPRPDRKSTEAGFSYPDGPQEGPHPPGTEEFVYWQCREAALAALEAWEALDGPLPRWARATPNPRKLRLQPNGGTDLNAYYDGQSVAFFEFHHTNKVTYSGASTDVVAHEVGHALLDAIRPDLWETPYTEVDAFHEGFGDLIAVLTALTDPESRRALLAASPDLSTGNFLEATAEDLSDGVRREFGSQHPAAEPRHALNTLHWQLPSTLPASGPPATLSREPHSFARVFTGCFYDVLRNIFTSLPEQNEQALETATQAAAQLLIRGTRNAPESARFFREVGRAMVLADAELHGGANHLAIRDAFAQHNIALGSAAMMAPTAALAGAAPKLTARVATLAANTRKDLLERLNAARGARLSLESIRIAGKRVAKAVHYRAIALGDVDRRLRGVVALAAEPVLVGAAGARAAILGALPEEHATADEVKTFVETLLQHDRIAFDSADRGAAAVTTQATGLPTHAVRTRANKRVLTRLRFLG